MDIVNVPTEESRIIILSRNYYEPSGTSSTSVEPLFGLLPVSVDENPGSGFRSSIVICDA